MTAKSFRLAGSCLTLALLGSSLWAGPAQAEPWAGPAQAAQAEPWAGPAQAAQAAAVTAVADTYVVQEVPNWSYGSAIKLAASNWSTPWHSHIYLRFQMPAPPPGKQVTSARLELTFSKLTNQPSTVDLRSVASTTWSESITYTTRPAIGGVIASVPIPGQGTPRLTIDITTLATTPGTKSFAITNPTSQSAAVFHSREQGADGPRIVLTYSETLCGASFAREGGQTWQQALAREDALFNGLEAVRFFHGGLPPAWPGPLEVGSRALVVSFKGNPREHLAGTHDAYMRQWFATAPRDRDIYWVYFHEPEDNIRDGQFSAADYRAAFGHLAALAEEAGNPRLRATQVLMQWTVVPASGRDWRDYYPGDGVLDVLAWDIYNFTPSAQRGEYEDPAELIDPAVAVNNIVGLPLGVAEMGSHIAAGDDGTKRAGWLRAMNDYLAAHGSLWNLYFDLDWPTGDYRLRDPASSAVWREFCS